MPKRRSRRVDHPACGACGYNVTGISRLSCPECGADLREVGILTPRMTRPLGVGGAIALWTLILPIPAMAISSLVIHALLPSHHVTSGTLNYGNPKSGAYSTLDVRIRGEGMHWPWEDHQTRPPIVHLEVEVTGGAGLSIMRIDPETMTCTYPPTPADVGRPGVEPVEAPFDADAVLAWFQTLKLDVSDPAVQQEATELAARLTLMINRSRAGQLTDYDPKLSGFSGRGASFSSSSGPWVGGSIAVGLFWLLVWALGCVYLRKRFGVAG